MADGVYPRINGAMYQSGQYDNQMVSIVGKFGSSQPDGTVQFVTSDDIKISLHTEYVAVPMIQAEPPAVEIVGQVADSQSPVMMFVIRELSADMDMGVYNQMIQAQHNPKYQQYFAPVQA